MPHIDVVLQGVRGAQAFAAIEFTFGYLQLSMHPDRQYLHAFMTPNSVMQPTRTTQGGCNTASNFLSCVEPCYSGLREHLLDWLDDFALFERTKNGLFCVLERFLQLSADHNLFIALPKSTFFCKKNSTVRTPN